MEAGNQEKEVVYQRFPVHCGINGNESADVLAQEKALKEQLCICFIKTRIKGSLRSA